MSEIQQTLRVPIHEERQDESGSFSDDTRTASRIAIIVGVTGTQKGASNHQAYQIRHILQKIYDHYSPLGEVWLDHGDCVGVDEETHEIAKSIGYLVCVHPPHDPKLRAFVKDADLILRPQLYSIRNHDIVRVCHYLLVVPRQENEILRSGTWSTWRYARKRKRPYTMIFPNGRLEGQRWREILKS